MKSVAAYIILSFVAIGRELENPFGDDVNDLPLDSYCRQVASEMDIITATPAPKMMDFMNSDENFVLYPLSLDGFDKWKDRSMSDIRGALRAKVMAQKNIIDEDVSVTTISENMKGWSQVYTPSDESLFPTSVWSLDFVTVVEPSFFWFIEFLAKEFVEVLRRELIFPFLIFQKRKQITKLFGGQTNITSHSYPFQ